MATDGGSSFDKVLAQVLPGVPRILCVYHISQNIKKNLAVKLGKEQWPVFRKAWSKLVKFNLTESLFEERWLQLLEAFPLAAPYLKTEQYGHRYMWSNVWTRQYTTFGARTTQRCESVNSALKLLIRRNSTLDVVFKAVLAISEKWAV